MKKKKKTPDHKLIFTRLQLHPLHLFFLYNPRPPLPHPDNLVIDVLVQTLVHHADGNVHGLRDLQQVLRDLTPQILNHVGVLIYDFVEHKKKPSVLQVFTQSASFFSFVLVGFTKKKKKQMKPTCDGKHRAQRGSLQEVNAKEEHKHEEQQGQPVDWQRNRPVSGQDMKEKVM